MLSAVRAKKFHDPGTTGYGSATYSEMPRQETSTQDAAFVPATADAAYDTVTSPPRDSNVAPAV